MTLFLSIVLALVVFGLVSTICSLFENGCRPLKKVEDENGNEVYTKISRNNLIKSAIIGVEVGLINYLSPKVAGALWLAPIFLIAMLAISGYLIYWFWKEGSSLKELLAFSLLILLVYLTTMSAAWMTTGLFASSAFMVSLVTLIPKLILIGSFGFFVISMILFRIKLANLGAEALANESKPKKEKKPKK
ncbi:MAG: hypothetical protein Q4B29_02955, partial [Candidatus Saccharibacteria bacterium]|nr:hypothetical protein [Candidatus Saccharibacteria bacterium]